MDKLGRFVLVGSFALFSSVLLKAQVHVLTYQPLNTASATGYSTSLDKMLLLSSRPNLLHIYDPAAATETTVALSDTPLSLSVSPDGTHAAVAHTSSVSYVNLSTATVEALFTVTLTNSNYSSAQASIVLTNQYLYIFPPSSYISSINLSTKVTTTSSIYNSYSYSSANILAYAPSQSAIYQSSYFGSGFTKYSVASGPISTSTSTATNSNFYCSSGSSWFSNTDSRLYTPCGYVFGISSVSKADGAYITRFAGNSQVQSVATAGSKAAMIPVSNTSATAPSDDNYVGYFDSVYLNQIGNFQLPYVDGASGTEKSHGKQVFLKSTGTAMYVLMQADTTSGLLNDWAVYKISLSGTPTCSPAFSASSANVDSSGGVGTATMTADGTCLYSATSDSDWISIVSGGYGGGNQTLKYIVRPNTGASRSGTISAGSSTFKITQAAAGTVTDLKRLGYHVIAADYSRALDKIIFVVSSPNELHLYDPVTSTDTYVALAAAPLSVAVSADGLNATVGYDGWLSKVDLSTLSASTPAAINQTAAAVADPGNGYAYFFSSLSYSSNLSSYAWSTGTTTTDTRNLSYSSGLATSQDGTLLFSGGPNEWDVTSGLASFIYGTSSCYGGLWVSADAGRVYTGCGTVLRVSSSTTQNFTANGSFSDLTNGIVWAANSSAQQTTAVIPATYYYPSTGGDINVRLYADDGLALKSQTALPGFLVNSAYYNGHGKYAFWNKAGTKLIVVEQADSTANLQSDFGVFVLDVSPNAAGCTIKAAFSGSAAGSGGSASISVTASAGCKWSVDLNGTSWLTAGNTVSGSGSGTVSVTVLPNNSSARSAAVSVGGTPVTVSQDAACAFTITPSPIYANYLGDSGTLTVGAATGCAWVVTNSNSWVTLSGTTSGTGSGTINYMIAPNTGTSTRSGYIYVGPSISSYSYNYTYVSQTSSTGSGIPYQTPGSANALAYVPLTAPCRVADTRNATGAFGGPIMAAGSTRTFAVRTSSCGIPAAAAAYSLNVTVVPTGVLGYLSLWPTGQTQPFVSTLNSDGRVKAAAAVVPAGTGGSVDVFVTHATHVVMDINGYYAPPPVTGGLTYNPLTPCRVSDTRRPNGVLGGPTFAGGDTKNIPILNSICSVASSAQAYSLNLTVIPKGVLGYLSDWPTGQTQPFVSSLNAPSATVTANAAAVGAGVSGSVSFFASHPTELVVDINGYYGSSSGGLYYYTVAPCRALDTRNGKSAFSGVNIVQLGGTCGIPTTAKAVVTNVTVVPQGALSYLSIWAAGATQPTVSTLNAEDGAVTSNLAITPLSSGGAASVFTTNPSHVIVDVVGYFAP